MVFNYEPELPKRRPRENEKTHLSVETMRAVYSKLAFQ